jgi:hypothetical protein
MLNLMKDLATPQGLNKEYRYEAIVVNNNDSKTDAPYTCRIQARIDILFDGIDDAHLPWAIPSFEHPDGASKDSGRAFVPKIGSKVLPVFQEGRETHPMWMGYPVDKTTVMEEMKHNYPNRVVTKLKNKAITVYDTQTNELFIRNPGDLKIYIQGNTELTVMGNVTEVVKGNKDVFVEGNLNETIKGNHTRTVGGNSTNSVSGNEKVSVGGNAKHSTGGDSSIQVNGTQVNNAGQMNDQVGGPDVDSPDSVSSSPDLTNWPGFPGGAKGNET